MQDGPGETIGPPAGAQEREARGHNAEVGSAGCYAFHEDGGGDADSGNGGDNHNGEERGQYHAHDDGLQTGCAVD